ncbi:hypothetical protein [Algoriphagus boritolerans]
MDDACYPSIAQSGMEELVFRNLDQNLGLSNSNVLSILRDSKG